MMQSNREIAAEILQRMEQERKHGARIVTAAVGLAFVLSVTGLSLIPWGMGTGPPIRAEASMLGCICCSA